MCSYLKNRKQRVQINNNFSATKSVIAGVPQGSIDGPLLFNLFINNLVLFLTETMLSNYADDNKLFSIGRDFNKVKDTLAKDFGIVTNWFYENFVVLNSKKCHFMCIGKDGKNETFTFKDVCYKSSKEEVILGITIDNKLSFDSHIRKMCKKSGQKLNALSRITTFLNKDQKSIIFNAMIKSQFSYCPIIWMFSSRRSNNLINKVHERSLRLITNDENSSFETLLQNINDITVHQINLQILMTEVYKIIKAEAPAITKNLFIFRENIHNIKNFQIIANENKNTVRYGLDTICYRTPYLWASLPEEYKHLNSVRKFKEKIKKWKCETCVCRLCRTYEQNLGFI